MDASWQPDPTGRHQYRWWDGAGWTESVADDGRASVDPLNHATAGGAASPAGSPPTVLGGGPAGGASSPFGAPTSTPFPSPGGSPLPHYSQAAPVKKTGKGKWIALGAVAVVALGVVGFLVLGGDSGPGTGTGQTDAEITKSDPVAVRKVKVKAGHVYSVRVAPQPGMDTKSTILIPAADADAAGKAAASTFSDLFASDTEFLADVGYTDAGSEFADVTKGAKYLAKPFEIDGAAGKADKETALVAMAAGTYTIAVRGATASDVGKIITVVDETSADAKALRAAIEPLSNRLSQDTTFTAELTKTTRFVIKKIQIKKGEAFRIRVEPSSKLDTRAALFASDADISSYATGLDEFISDEDTFDPNEYITDAFSDATDVFTDDQPPEEVASERGQVFDEDGSAGEPDAVWVYGYSDLSLTLVIGAYGDDTGTVKVIFERYTGAPVTDFSDAVSTFSDDPFFSDSNFYTESEPYTGS